MNLTFILDNQLANAKTGKSILPNFTKRNMSIGNFVFASSYVKHKEFD